MASRGQDTLIQIQKYKAMLSSKRNKGEDKAIRKPKKKRLQKEHVETGLETVLGVPGLVAVPEKQQNPNELRTENVEQENVDSADLQASTVPSQESKQSAEPLTTVVEPVEQMSRKSSLEDQEQNKEEATGLSADAGPTVDEKEDEKQKKEKSKGLSIQKKRKKLTKKRKESTEKEPSIAQEDEDEEKLKETFSLKENALEQGENSAVLLSPDAKKEESGVEVNSEQDVEEKEANNKENTPKEGAEGKEKVSRAEKFKRWVSFTKQKKTGDAVVIENESYDSEISKSTSQAIQIPVSEADKATEGDLKDGNLTDVEKVDTEVWESSPLPKKQRRRSVSLSEATDKEKETLSTDNDQRTRPASFGKGNILGSLSASLRRDRSKKKSREISNQDTASGVETASSQVDKIPESWKAQNNESVNESESKQALEQKTDKSIVEDGEQSFEVTGDYSAELDEQESPKKDKQPRRKKRSFLRKISSKNLKVNKKDEESTTGKSRKLEISAPLIKSENQVEEIYFKTVGEVSPEKPYKRKKSGLNVKLPEALKKITGAETEKEIEKDEPLTQENVERTEKNDENYEQSQESEEMCDDSLNADETHSGDTNADSKEEKSECREEESTRDGKVYFCRALMNDVIKELKDRLANLEQEASEEENDEVHYDYDDDDDDDETVEESTLVNDTTSSVFDDLTSLEDYNSLDGVLKEEEEENCKELTYVDESAIAPEGGKEILENVQKQPEENDEQKPTLQPEIILESKERKEVNLPQGPESEPKQPEDEPKRPDNILETEQPEQVAEQITDLSQTSEVSSDESEKELVRQEKCEVQKHHAGEKQTTETDGFKTPEMEDEKDGFCEEEDNKETEKDNSGDGFPKVQNVQEECQSPEDVVQSESEQKALQTMALNDNENNKQPLTRGEGENTKEGSVILSLLHHGEPGNPSEGYSEPFEWNDKSVSKVECAEEVGRFAPTVFMANLLEMVLPSSYTGSPTDTKTDIVYKLVMQTADQTYSTLVNLVSAFLTRAGQIPKKVLVSVLIHLIKKYPQCFKIKKIKRRTVLSDDQAAADDTVM